MTSAWSTSGPTDPASTYKTAYDLWFDPNANQPGRNTGAELMVAEHHRRAADRDGGAERHHRRRLLDIWRAASTACR